MRSDAELVEAALQGEREAFGVLVHRYRRAACAAAADVLGDPHAAQDAAQDAFVSAYEKLGALRAGSAFGPWVVRIARRRALDMVRRQRPAVSLERRGDPADYRDNGQLDEQSRLVLSAVMALPPHERRAVMLRYFEGLAVEEIARIAGRSVGTVSKQLTRARQRLRKRLKDLEP